jgi:predicted enzyme related to lactoylglutathione lyase
MNRVTHFEIYTADPKAVQPFYEQVFGWKFNKFEGGPIEYWLINTGDDKDSGESTVESRVRGKGKVPGP